MDTIINWLNGFFSWLSSWFTPVFNWLKKFWEWIETALDWLLDGLILLLKFVAFTLIDGLLTVIEGAINLIDFSAMAFSHAANWANLPDQAIWLIASLGLPQCIAMLGGAYLIRLTLNLIPSWATRV